jgi:hypothetical protein
MDNNNVHRSEDKMKSTAKTLKSHPSKPLQAATGKPTAPVQQAMLADEFIIKLKFANNLPNAPSGPFLKAIPYINNGSYSSLFDNKFPEYRTSTLEKGYTWQPHFGPDLGIHLDLVDQDAMLATSSENGSLTVDQSDLKYLTGSVDSGRGKLAQLDQQSKPLWLRNTTYMENNLFQRGKDQSKGIQARSSALSLQKKEMLSTEFIDDSFSLVQVTITNLISKATKLKVHRIMPLLPCDAAIRHPDASINDVNSHSFVLFDEDPSLSIHNQNNHAKRRKISDGIITNARKVQSKDGAKAQPDIDVSLVSAGVEEEEKKQGDDTRALDGSWVEYQWVRDYRMEMHTNEHKDCFVFVYNKSDDSSNNSSLNMEYYPIDSRIEMKRLNPEESLPHDALVKRDHYSSLFSS